jgi:hypothetical protein
MLLTVYTPTITERIKYTINLVFVHHLNMSVQIVDSWSDFETVPSPKIVYAPAFYGAEPFFWQHPLMTEHAVRKQEIQMSEYEHCPVFFPSPESNAQLPFDIFAVVFYLITRYEEYLPYKKDNYGRFSATESLAFKEGFLQIPLADMLILKLAERLQHVCPDFSYTPSKFTYIATYDIDNACIYRHKGLIRTCGGLVKQFIKGNFKEIYRRLWVLIRLKNDPNDNFEYLQSLGQKFHIPEYYFILYAEQSKYDRGLDPSNRYYKTLIRTLASRSAVGIHPSFAAATDSRKLKKEIQQLSLTLNRPIIHCRSHFLKLSFPDTYRQYLANGILEDFTMGFADHSGFRAATCKSFLFFDLEKNISTPLIIHPFAYMDETLKRYRSMSPNTAFETICQLMDVVDAVGGTFIALWHNDNFTTALRPSWGNVYEKSLEYAAVLMTRQNQKNNRS